MARLDGSAVVITGASSGIGRAAAGAFAARGARVVLAARRADVLDALIRDLRATGAEAVAVPTDVTEPEAVAETYIRPVRHPRDEVAVGWPARLAQVGYALAPYPTWHLMGAGFRWALDRAGPGPRTHGALRAPTPRGTRADGGWRARKEDCPRCRDAEHGPGRGGGLRGGLGRLRRGTPPQHPRLSPVREKR